MAGVRVRKCGRWRDAALWAHHVRYDGRVVAVSGGPDSMALLAALHERNCRDELGWRLHAAHLNHGLRGAASDEDERFVAAECRSRGIDLANEP